MNLAKPLQDILLATARESITYGCVRKSLLPVDPTLWAITELRQMACTFVTLKMPVASPGDDLRGCVGSLSADQPLVQDTIEHAYAAAFRDPRFPPVASDEIPLLRIAISIISPQETLQFDNQEELLQQIRPELDGLIIQSQGRRATFLPSVWEQISGRTEFLRQLKLKAGFAPDYWNCDFKAFRYQADYFQE